MKRNSLLVLVFLLLAGYGYAQTPLNLSEKAIAVQKTQKAATDNSIELSYCSGNLYRAVAVGAGYDVEAAIFIPKEMLRKYEGSALTSIVVGFGVHAASNTQVFVRNASGSLDYSQAATFETSKWNEITLTTPQELTADEDLYIGYSYRGANNNNCASIGLDDSPVTNPNSDLIRFKKTTATTYGAWQHIGAQDFPNICIVGIVEGDHLPQIDVDLYSLTVPSSAIGVNDLFSITGSLKNIAVQTITDLEISYQVGSNEKVTTSFTGLDIANNRSYDWEIANIDFTKVADNAYPLVVTVETINGQADEDPANNTQQALIRVWDAPEAPSMVVTSAENKNAVIEEYTGIYCQYCPDGHKRVNQIMANNPERALAINIHQGGYAIPDVGDPDFRTPWGNALAAQTGLTGYPAATINRHVFSGSATASSTRSQWTAQAAQIINQSSYVNIAVAADIDAPSRTLAVDVELYYTGEGPAVNLLNVALLQDSIISAQTGATANYPAMGNDNAYRHNHMLRELLTGQWGDSISSTEAGTFVAKRYYYAIPEDYRGIPVNLNKLEVIAFVAEGKQEIITGASSHWKNHTVGVANLAPAASLSAAIRDGLLFINSEIPVQSVEIYNVSGQRMLSKALLGQTLPVSTLPSGVYIAKLKTAEGDKIVKVIK